eukprot:CAMPEP_0116103692 /NCGR_PEP_ID=MMETSP0327-20121206/14022_1 /TAXON_ID=44447 /ORGANISM="Pseudo-nitzschia delicatissima, Strain B596" /LENGTH=178 /DNA_ID=CAMNT_0003595823 /DNA_START=57 /DNA_END=593 /DNA_ORIENTATION=+
MAREEDCGDDLVVSQKTHNDDGSSVRQRLLSGRCIDALLDWIVFPLLLFIQFGTTMYCQQEGGTLNIRWMPAMGLIAIFCLASVIYRNVFRVHPIQSITLLILPEVFTNITLVTVMFVSDLMTAANTLTVLTLILLVLGAIGNIQLAHYERSVTAPKASGYKLLHPEENEDSGEEWIC